MSNEFVFVFQNHKLQYYNIKTDTKQQEQNIELGQKANQIMSVKCSSLSSTGRHFIRGFLRVTTKVRDA